ncbi:T-cell surface glycoprotein CD3 zeta chain-like [Centroberyx gerrardi]|uniref:T-cell surface glycoprotein CD3 zeta chain-like n=1 Tax=Centroberyx gerrardi TaxID=166262 RepID=UPI003AAAE0B7
MDVQKSTWGLLVFASPLPLAAAASQQYDPKLCYILDGFLVLYGLAITAMFVKEKFFKTKSEDPRGRDAGGHAPLAKGDPGRGRNRGTADDTYADLNGRPGGEYKELPVRRERHRRGEQVYQGLSKTSKDTYDSLHMRPLPR